MVLGTASVKIHMPWVHSLKEKRMVVKSISAKVRNQYNVSIAETEEQDIHQIAVLGFAGVAGDRAQADSIVDHVLNFIESNTEGEVISVHREIVDI
jgi:uncharacterized protein YlxP (DUF503 family)